MLQKPYQKQIKKTNSPRIEVKRETRQIRAVTTTLQVLRYRVPKSCIYLKIKREKKKSIRKE